MITHFKLHSTHTLNYINSQVLINVPILLVDVLVIGIPVYFMVGFAPQAGPFFTFLAIMMALNLAADNFYR